MFKRIGIWVAPWLFFCAAAIFMTWPMVLQLNSAVIGSLGDNVYYVWLMGWFPKALFQYHINPLFVPFHNFPEGWPLAYTEITLSNVILGLPFTLLGGEVLGYNMTLLLSFVLSGWLVYRWTAEITGNRWAGLVAGTIFAFSPFRMSHAYGHLPLMGTQWLVLHFMGMYSLLVKEKITLSAVLCAGLGFGLAALSSMYFLYMTAIMSVVFVLGYCVIVNWRMIFSRHLWLKMAAAGAVALPLLGLAVFPYLQLARNGDANHRPIEEVDMFSASPVDFLLPAPTNSLWGEEISKLFPPKLWIERYVYLGAVPLILTFIAGWFIFRQHKQTRRMFVWGVLMVLAAIILAMGTHLRLTEEFISIGQHHIPLPNYLLFKYLPFYNSMRAWERYGVFADLFISILGGVGFAILADRLRGRRWLAALFIVSLILIGMDFHLNFNWTELHPQPLDLWLAQQPGTGSVVQFPIYESSKSGYVYGSLIHQKPLLGMYYGAYFPASYKSILPDLADFPNDASIAILKQRGVQYVVVDAAQYPQWGEMQTKLDKFPLIKRTEMGQWRVFELLK